MGAAASQPQSVRSALQRSRITLQPGLGSNGSSLLNKTCKSLASLRPGWSRVPQLPPVAVYTAVLADGLALAAALAGAGAVVAKSSPITALLGAVRALARAPRTLQPVSWRAAHEVAVTLDPVDNAILALRLAGDAPAENGGALGLPIVAVRDRLTAIIARVWPVTATSA